ncbi:hypothetical protein R1sor_010949 [Riccia sorocarpa]|uniref:Uncharacterized protein n=1 Tax=Riccia sorocarpa TaxID=122646 RepID=A0ABD3HZI5_9MARC
MADKSGESLNQRLLRDFKAAREKLLGTSRSQMTGLPAQERPGTDPVGQTIASSPGIQPRNLDLDMAEIQTGMEEDALAKPEEDSFPPLVPQPGSQPVQRIGKSSSASGVDGFTPVTRRRKAKEIVKTTGGNDVSNSNRFEGLEPEEQPDGMNIRDEGDTDQQGEPQLGRSTGSGKLTLPEDVAINDSQETGMKTEEERGGNKE